jgi:hypothetical protein
MKSLFKIILLFSFVIVYLTIYFSISPFKIKNVNEKNLPRIKISKNEKTLAIVQVSNNRNSHISNRFINNKENYTKFHNYGYFVENPEDPSRLPTWNKLKATLKAFQNDYKWVWQLDIDTIIMNHNIEVHVLANYAEINNYHVIFNKDCNGINAGSIFFRNSNFTINFINTLWNMYGKEISTTDEWNEQRAMMYLMDKNKNNKEFLRNILFVPQTSINSYPNENIWCTQGNFLTKGDLIIHFAGMHRDELYTKYFDLCQQFYNKVDKFNTSMWIESINNWNKDNFNITLL